MKEEEKHLLRALVRRAITKQQFLESFPSGSTADRNRVLELLNEAEERKNADDAEDAMVLGFALGFREEHVPVLCRLLSADWHRQHENIAMALQKLKDSRTVDPLYEAALKELAYLDYDESRALAVKCIWALSAIATEEAKAKLQLLTQNANPIIRDAAQHQLERLGRPE